MNEENVSAESISERTIIPQGTVAVTIGADSAAICSAKEGVAVKVSEVTDERFAR